MFPEEHERDREHEMLQTQLGGAPENTAEALSVPAWTLLIIPFGMWI